MNEFKPLNFTPAPPQQQASDLMALLQAMGGLGLNIAGAATKTGAVGNQLNQQSMQTQAQATENQREQNKMQGLEKQSTALWNQAQSMGMPLPQLATVQADLENRDINNAQQNIRWFESALREKKADEKSAVQEARFAIQSSESELKQDPNARIAQSLEAIRGLKDPTLSNIQVKVAPFAKGKEDAKQLAKSVYDLVNADKSWYIPDRWDAPAKTADDIIANDQYLSSAKSKIDQVNALKKLLPGLAAPDAKKRAAAYAQFQQLQSGVAPTADAASPAAPEMIRVQDLKTGQTGTMPATEFDSAKYKRIQ
jgi:hypothetical protein